MPLSLPDRVEYELKRARLLYVRELPYLGLRPDFMAATRGPPIIIEVKSRIRDPTEARRTLDLTERLLRAINGSAALVVVPDSVPEIPEQGLIHVSRLVRRLRELGARPTQPAPSPLADLAEGEIAGQTGGGAAYRSFAASFLGHVRLPARASGASTTDTPAENQLFVAMPFAAEYDDVYFVAVKRAAEQRDLGAVRIDQTYFSGEIVPKIKAELERSVAVVADVSGANPNVLYEVGFAHALGKPMVQITRTPLASLPFDVRGWNTIHYDAGRTHALATTLDSALRDLGI